MEIKSDGDEIMSENNKEIKIHNEDSTLTLKQCSPVKKEFERNIFQGKLSQDELLPNSNIFDAIKTEELEIKDEPDFQVNYDSEGLKIESKESLFACQECDVFFDKNEYLDDHISNFHEKKESKVIFDQGFENDKEFLDINFPLKSEPYGCHICFEGFSQMSDLKDHMESHNFAGSSKVFSNLPKHNTEGTLSSVGTSSHLKCDKMLKAKNLKSYKRTHTVKKPTECDICKKKFKHSGDFKRHKFTHTGEKPHECKICKKKFILKVNLKRHELTHTGEKPHKCDICKKTFIQSGDLKGHKLTHTGEKPHECEICKKKFILKVNLKRHELTHTGEKPHKCDICKKTFIQRGELNRHKLTHTGERPYECEICKKKFIVNGDLRKHNRIHSGGILYECDICKKKFIQSGNLKRHKLSHAVKKLYECDICKKFITLQNLKAHKRTHSGEKLYECEICRKKFKRGDHLRRHKLIHTGEKP